MTLRATDLRMRAWLGGLALGGAAAAHALAYVVAVPDPHQREAVLHATAGHGYWIAFVPVAVGALVAGLCGLILSADGRATATSLFRRTAARLVPLQVFGFVAIEVTERAFTGTGPWEVLQEPAVLIGIVLQALVALVGAGLLVAFRAAIDRLRGSRRRPASLPWSPPLSFVTQHLGPPASPAAGGAGLRGPPVVVS
ncbi:MAG: hypothetical protein ACRDKB_04035 [Actinomycetota bacterium]